MKVISQDTPHECVRKAIIDAVGHLLKRYGYKKMTVDDIAQEAGIGKGTVYLHFPSKEEVALSWFDRLNNELMNSLRGIASCNAEPVDRLQKLLLARVLARFDGCLEFQQSLDDIFAAVRPSLLLRRDRYLAEEAIIFQKVLEDGCAEGIFDIDDLDAVSQSMLLATNSLLPYNLSAVQLGKRDEIEAKAQRIADILLHGLLHR